MKAIGLTGGIGMGKSTAAEFLRARGIPVVDTDDLARQIVQPGAPALAEIQQTFGADLIDAAGQLRRKALAEIVFNDSVARARLEAITHPRITQLWQLQLEAWRCAGRSWGVVVIPLLFETNVASQFDAVVCVACTGGTQQQRLRQRGWSEQQIQQRINSQLPVAEKIAWANFVVWTEGVRAVSEGQLAKIIPG